MRYNFFRHFKFPSDITIHEFWGSVLNDLAQADDPFESIETWLSEGGDPDRQSRIAARVSDMRCVGSNRIRKVFYELVLCGEEGIKHPNLQFKNGRCNLSAVQLEAWRTIGVSLQARKWWTDKALVFKLLQASLGPVPYSFLGESFMCISPVGVLTTIVILCAHRCKSDHERYTTLFGVQPPRLYFYANMR